MAELPKRWGELQALFDRSLELPADQRVIVLDGLEDDPELRDQLEALLTADAAADAQGFFGAEDLPRPRAPISVGAYELVRKIGEGGMSEVWLALRADRQFQRRVAIKLLRRQAAGQELLERMARERQILASLDHPNIAKLFDAGTTDDGRPYVVMELVEGESITEHCDYGRLDLDQRLRLFRTLCGAVHAAHQNLVVHRDIKPSNVLVTPEGIPKLLDFGIAKWLNPEVVAGATAPTQPWQRLLTPDYASPEQIQGRPVATPSDVYSLGVLLYELLTGRLPRHFVGLRPAEIERRLDDEPEAVLASRRAAEPKVGEGPDPLLIATVRRLTPQQLVRRLEGDLDTVLAKALAPIPSQRYGSAAQLADDLRRFQEGRPVAARPPTWRYRTGRFLRRHRASVLAVVAFLGLLMASAIGFAGLSLRLAEERNQVVLERDKARLFGRLLRDVFEVADPGEQSLELTARDILRRGAERLGESEVDSPEVRADLMATIGKVDRRLGLYEDARPLLENALELRRRVYGDQHVLVAQSLTELGALRRDTGDYTGAEVLLEKALELRRRLLGENHPAVGESLEELALLLRERGQYDEAESLLRRVLERFESSEKVAEVRSILAGLLHQKGVFGEAETLHRQVLAEYRQRYGDRHPATAQALNDLASALIDQGRFEEPEPLLLEALDIYRARKWSDDHPVVISSLSNLGALATFQRDFAKAEGYYREAYERALVSMGPDHPNVSYILSGLGAARRQLGDLRGAEEALRRAAEIRRRAFGPGHILTTRAEGLLGACLRDLGQYREAESLLLSVVRVYAQLVPPRPREQRKMIEHLALLYEAMGDPAAAAQQRSTLEGLDGDQDPPPENS